MTTIKCDFNSDPCDGINKNSQIKISSTNIYNNSMSNPSNTASVPYPTYNTATSTATPPKTVSSPPPSSIADSFFSISNAKKEWYKALPEVVVVFGLSFGISMYMGDDAMTAVERGTFMALGQYTGQIAIDAMPKPVSDTQIYLYDAEKFAIATSIFIGGNKYIISSRQPIKNLLLESAVASIIAHYTYNATQNLITKSSSVVSQYSHLY